MKWWLKACENNLIKVKIALRMDWNLGWNLDHDGDWGWKQDHDEDNIIHIKFNDYRNNYPT